MRSALTAALCCLLLVSLICLELYQSTILTFDKQSLLFLAQKYSFCQQQRWL